MIIQNGTLLARRPSRGGIDPETGHPVKAAAEWCDPVPCQYSPVTVDRRGRANGERFTMATYTALVEGPYEADRVRLLDGHGGTVGEFAVISAEWLEAVCQTRVLL